MRDDSEDSRGDILEYISVATIQFPFIPVVIHPESNWLSEPDGGINFWLLGQEKKEIPYFHSLPIIKPYKKRIEEYLSSDYQNWLVLTVRGILDSIIKTKDVDIILFPEYSLPLEINTDLQNILKIYSKGRCIVGGIGSVCKNVGEEKKNRFVVAKNGELVYAEKIVPNEIEGKIGIVGGEGPLIHELNLNRFKEDKKIYTEILMCSDYIEKVKSGSRVQYQINKELDKNKLNPEDIKVSLVPAFSTKTEDMESISNICAPRFYDIVILVNCGFFGGSCISYPPIVKGKFASSSQKIKSNESACMIADIPTKFLGKPFSTSIGKKPEKPMPEINIYKILFKGEKEDELGFKLDSESLFSLIVRRLNAAITLSGIAFARSPPNGEVTELIIDSSRHWKKLQDAINSLANHPESSYKSAWSSDIIAFHEMMEMEEENLYTLILDKTESFIPDDACKIKVQRIKEYVKNIWLPAPKQWESEL